MTRAPLLQLLEKKPLFDVVIIGGGATGLGAAVDAASRDLKTLLVEGADFAKGTSSRSTKLIHGGLRYLQQGNIALVKEALRERGFLLKNAPHIVKERAFIVPNYHWWESPFFAAGLKIYDLLAGELGLHPSKHLNEEETISHVRTLNHQGLYSSTLFHDGQFDDARLAICLLRTFQDLKGVAINYMKVTALLKEEDLIKGVLLQDQETMQTYPIHARCIVNATGIFTDSIRKMDDPLSLPIIVPSQGIHLVLDAHFLPGETGVVIPHTEDGRVLFMVPWQEKILIGTTDTPIKGPCYEPTPLQDEIEFLLKHLNEYLSITVTKHDILSVFAGIRPLVKEHHEKKTAKLARNHKIFISKSNLITIAGGKWTTYRKMGEDVIDEAISNNLIKAKASQTQDLKLHGYMENANPLDPLGAYGTDIYKIQDLYKKTPILQEPLHPKLPYIKAQVVFAIRYEMARTIEDILARRTRCLFLDAKAAFEAAPIVAELLAQELFLDSSTIDKQLKSFESLAQKYLP